MNRKWLLIISIFLVLATLAVSYNLSIAKQPLQTTQENTVTATILGTATNTTLLPGVVATMNPNRKPELIFEDGLPNTLEAQAVIRAIENAHAVDVKGSHALDTSEFSTVFINDPRFPVKPGTLDTIRRLSHNPSLESAGWLDYKTVFVNAIKEQQMRPKAQNAVPTDTPAPTSTIPPGVIYDPLGPPPPLIFKSINIESDIAKVVINEGALTYELTLVFVDGKWYIAAYHGMGVSP